MNFFTKPRSICWLLLVVIGGLLCLSYIIAPKSERTILYFSQSNGGIGVEERYLPRLSESEFAVSLIDEMLLGPADHRFLRFSDPELRPRSCFVRDNVLYVDLPVQILTSNIKTPDFYTVYTLLEKNITINCKSIDIVHVYIDGTPAYSRR